MLCTRSPMELMSLCGGMPSLDWILESTLKVVANRGIAGIPTSSSGPLRMVWSSGAPRAESMADSEDLGAAQFGTDWQVFPQHKQSKRSAVSKKELFRVERVSSTRDTSKTKSVFNCLSKACIVTFDCLIFLPRTLSCIVWLQCGFMKRPCANGWLLRSSFARLANSFLICKLANVWSTMPEFQWNGSVNSLVLHGLSPVAKRAKGPRVHLRHSFDGLWFAMQFAPRSAAHPEYCPLSTCNKISRIHWEWRQCRLWLQYVCCSSLDAIWKDFWVKRW